MCLAQGPSIVLQSVLAPNGLRPPNFGKLTRTPLWGNQAAGYGNLDSTSDCLYITYPPN